MEIIPKSTGTRWKKVQDRHPPPAAEATGGARPEEGPAKVVAESHRAHHRALHPWSRAYAVWRKIASVVRAIAKSVAMEEEYELAVSVEAVGKILNPRSFRTNTGDSENAGVVTGLPGLQRAGISSSWRPVWSRTGKLSSPGNLGEVMKNPP